MTLACIRPWAGSLRRLLAVGLQAKESVTSASCAEFQKPFQHQWSLEDLLADDMTQSVMRADGVDFNLVRTLFSELKGRGRAGTIRPVKHQLRVFCRRAFNRLLPCKLPSGSDGPYLQGSLLVVSAAVAWLALGRL